MEDNVCDQVESAAKISAEDFAPPRLLFPP